MLLKHSLKLQSVDDIEFGVGKPSLDVTELLNCEMVLQEFQQHDGPMIFCLCFELAKLMHILIVSQPPQHIRMLKLFFQGLRSYQFEKSVEYLLRVTAQVHFLGQIVHNTEDQFISSMVMPA
jgi:hypothetical protein